MMGKPVNLFQIDQDLKKYTREMRPTKVSHQAQEQYKMEN